MYWHIEGPSYQHIDISTHQHIRSLGHQDIGILEVRYIKEGCIEGWRILEPRILVYQCIGTSEP